MNHIYHIAKTGSNHNAGTEEAPFQTIQKAAGIARPGDTIIVHEGTYREWVNPVYGGRSEHERITYQAAEGEKVVIKGSEIITDWQPLGDGLWKAEIDNTLFGEYNPYVTPIYGDWLFMPDGYEVHTGEVYLNGKALFEARSLEEVKHPQVREAKDFTAPGFEPIPFEDPEWTSYVWFAEVGDDSTTIYANFHETDPRTELVEINVRKACFYPKEIGRNYITVKGFELAQAAGTWAPPTSDQWGLIGPHWAKGWIIEDNIIHDAKTSAICLGKEISTGNNECTDTLRKPGYQMQLEAVFKAHKIGWRFDNIGSHIVRNNTIYDCGQNGVVGHLGCIGSVIENNHIYHIGVKREYFGWEIAGIKLHAALDVVIRGNVIHDSLLGTWLDWQAQGARVTGNIFWHNDRDLMVEVSHGPYLVDNNIFASKRNLDNASQGGAYVHNLFAGYHLTFDVLNRSTPYHYAHTTEVAGFALVYGGDDRYFNNLFLGLSDTGDQGTNVYSGYPKSLDEYVQRVRDLHSGDVERFEKVRQPFYADGNVFLGAAKPAQQEENYLVTAEKSSIELGLTPDGVELNLTLPEDFCLPQTAMVDTERLGTTRITELEFENPDGTPLVIDTDIMGIKRGLSPVSGPLEGLKPGKNTICLK